MKNTNQILENMPQYGMYNEAGFIPAYVHFELTKSEFQDIVLEFAKGFIPDVFAVTWLYDKEKDRSSENGCTRLFMIFKEDAKSVTGKFGEDTVLNGNTNFRSSELVGFLKKYAMKTRSEDGFVGPTGPVGGGALRVDRTIGFELDPLPILETIFDSKGYSYAKAIGDAGKDNYKYKSKISWGEVTTDGRVSGLYVRKIITAGVKTQENFNGKLAPRRNKAF